MSLLYAPALLADVSARSSSSHACTLQNMFVATWSSESQSWSAGQMQPYGPISMMPSAQVLNYGQSVFEGMKAQNSGKGRVVLFRPQRNAARMKQGAARMSMPHVPEELFVEAVRSTVKANIGWVRSIALLLCLYCPGVTPQTQESGGTHACGRCVGRR
jgi:branched-subunit amino acid aminotransferase/4-amino-4-deoxychorismate lyase